MVNSSVIEYHLFAAHKTVQAEDIDQIGKSQREMNQRRPDKNAAASDWRVRWFYPNEKLTAARYQWLLDQPSVMARAMCVAGDVLLVAGPPDVVDERYAYHRPDVPDVRALLERQEEAYAGEHGGQLWVIRKIDGEVLSRHQLEAMPVFDAMAVAGGRVFVSTVDGVVRSFSSTGLASLPALDAEPLETKWSKPEDPKYLLPLPERKEEDFVQVRDCKVFSSDLGYQLMAPNKETLGVALQKLDQPLTGTVTLKTKIRAVPQARGLLKNGYLVFGDRPDEALLVKCGVRLQPQTAAIIQGPFEGDDRTTVTAPVDAPDDKGLQATVTVDLDQQTVEFVANGQRLRAKLKSPLTSITHVGYLMTGARIDVAPIEIEPRQ